MNSLCSTGSGMSGLTSSNILLTPDPPTNLEVNYSISLPLDSDPDLILHYPFNQNILNYGSSTSLNTNLGPDTGVSDATVVGPTTSNSFLNNTTSIYENGTSVGISNKLLHFYTFETTDKSGNTLINRASGNYDLTIDASCSIDGSLFIPSSISVNPPTGALFTSNYTLNPSGFTFGLMIYPTLIPSTGGLQIFSLSSNTTLNDAIYMLHNNSNIIQLWVSNNSNGYLQRIFNSVAIDTLYFIVCVLTPTNLFVTINGTKTTYPVGSTGVYFPTNLVKTRGSIGRYINSTSNSFQGRIDNFFIYNDVLTDSQIQTIYTNDYSPFYYYLSINNVPTNTGGYSFSFWVYLNSKIGTVFSFANGLNSTAQIYCSFNGNKTFFSCNNSTYTYTATSLDLYTWYHITWTLNTANQTKIYLNGELRITTSSITYSSFAFNDNLIMMDTIYNSSLNKNGLNGYMNDFRYYKRILDSAEVKQLYNINLSINLNSDPSLCLYYTFDTYKNTLSNYAQNVYGTVDASYVNGASVNYTDVPYIGTGGLKLLGTNSGYVQLLPTSVVNTTNFISNSGMTFACWFYSIDSNNNAPIFDFGTDTGDDIILSIFNNQILCKMLNTGTFYSLSSLATYNKSFRHVVWTMSYSAAATSTWNLYIDASRVNTISTNKYPLQVARNKNYLGKSNYVSDPSFNGYIDEFRVYQRVLTQAEINQIYAYNNTLNVKSTNLSWTAADTSITPLTYNYFYKDNSLNITSTPVNTSSTNSVVNNLIDGNGITYSVNTQVRTKQSNYVSVTK